MENIKNEIISNSRHQIIYGSNSEERIKLLMELSKENPVVKDENDPIAIYIDDFNPNINEVSCSVDKNQVSILCKDYFSYLVAFLLTEELKKIKIESCNLKNFLQQINNLYLNFDQKEIGSLEELSLELKKAKDFHLEKLTELVTNGNIKINFAATSFWYFELERFIRKVKQVLNDDSYIMILLNYEEDVMLEMQKVVNNLISSRINKDISIKLATDRKNIKTYHTQNGQLIEAVHDFEVIYLDDDALIKEYGDLNAECQSNKINEKRFPKKN